MSETEKKELQEEPTADKAPETDSVFLAESEVPDTAPTPPSPQEKRRLRLLRLYGVFYILSFVALFVFTQIVRSSGFELYEIFVFALLFSIAVSEFMYLLTGKKHIFLQLARRFRDSTVAEIIVHVLAIGISHGVLIRIMLSA